MRAAKIGVLALALVFAAGDARAQRGRPAAPAREAPADVETAEQLYAKLDYEQANSVAERIVKERGLTHDQIVRAYRVLAVTYAILDREEAARETFLKLLVYDPDYQVDPNLGPKVNNPFVEARGVFRALSSRPGIEVATNVRSDGGQLRVTTRDPTKIVKKVVVGYRWTSSGEYRTSQISAGEGVPVEVAPAPVGRTRLDFYAQALDERDNAVIESGNPNVPKSAFAETARGGDGGGAGGGSVFASPFFWGFTGAAVIGGGLALFFALRPQDPPTRALLGPTLQCGADPCK